MTDRKYQLIGAVSRSVSHRFTTMPVSLFAGSGGYAGFFVRNLRTGDLLLPVQVGGGISLIAENRIPLMGAYPARLGTTNGDWRNVFAACPVTDLSAMPSDGGMMEAKPNGRVKFDAMRLPGRLKAEFVVTADGVGYEGETYDRIEVGYRFPVDPNNIPGLPAGAIPRGGGRGVSVGTGPVVGDERENTGVEYLREAHSFGVIRFVDRTEVATWLADDGLGNFDPANDRDWSTAHLYDIGERLVDINLEPVAG